MASEIKHDVVMLIFDLTGSPGLVDDYTSTYRLLNNDFVNNSSSIIGKYEGV